MIEENNNQSFNSIDFGKKLTSLRRVKSVTIEEISKKTKISINHIKNIEKGDFYFIDVIYVFGFIENYCLELGEEGKGLFEENKKNIHSILNKNKKEVNIDKSKLKTNPISPKKNYRLLFLFIFIIILVISSVTLYFAKNKKSNFFVFEKIRKQDNEGIKKITFNKKNNSLKLFLSNQIIFEKDKINLQLIKINDEKVEFNIKNLMDNSSSNFTLYNEKRENLNISSNFNLQLRIEKNNQNYIILYLENNLFNKNKINYAEIWQTNTRLQHSNFTVILSRKPKEDISVYVKATFLPSYVSYNIDGYRTSKNYLQKDEFFIITANELIQLDIGNYLSVILIVNEIPIQLLETGTKKSYATSKIIRWVNHKDNNNYFDLIIKSATKYLE